MSQRWRNESSSHRYQKAIQGQAGLACRELAAWFISLWQRVPSQKLKLPIKREKKKPNERPLHSWSPKVTFPALAECTPQERGSYVVWDGSCVQFCWSSAWAVRAKISWLESKSHFVKSPHVAASCWGANGSLHTGAGCFTSDGTRARLGPGKCCHLGPSVICECNLSAICECNLRLLREISDAAWGAEKKMGFPLSQVLFLSDWLRS